MYFIELTYRYTGDVEDISHISVRSFTNFKRACGYAQECLAECYETRITKHAAESLQAGDQITDDTESTLWRYRHIIDQAITCTP